LCALEALADEAIDRERPGAVEKESWEAGDIEQDDLITNPSELCARGGHGSSLIEVTP